MRIYYRAVTQSCRNIFSVETGYRMDDNQYINPFQPEIFYQLHIIFNNTIEDLNLKELTSICIFNK